MKRISIIVLLMVFLSCNDGDLQIESVDFEAATVDMCATASDEKLANTFFFKIQDDEALLLTMTTGQFKNATSIDGSIVSTISASAAPTLVYRLFTGTVAKSYFCDAVPATDPTVVKENTASGGELIVTTAVSKVEKGTKTYTHAITINDLSLTNDQGERLTDTAGLDYGSFTTTTPNSASLVNTLAEKIPFSNYSAIAATACDTPPATGKTRLFKLANDELISLDIPNVLIANAATDDNPRTASFDTGILFKNTVLSILATKDMGCADSIDSTIEQWSFVASEGQITVTTVANAPNSEGLTYTHTLLLTDVKLILKHATDSTKDIALDVVPSIDFGTYTTIAP